MKRIAIFIFTIGFMACSKDELFDIKLVSIDYSEDDRSWSENYTYLPDGKLEKIENFRSLGTRYEMSYQNDRLKEIVIYRIDDNKLIFRDSLLYDTDGVIQSIHHFSTNAGEGVPLSTIDEFEYDDAFKVSKKSTYSVRADKYTYVKKYFWKNNNIDKIENYTGEDKLRSEFFFKYDNKVNYKKGLPTSASSPLFWDENNITKSEFIDHLGVIDASCNPCKTDYKYNSAGYPIVIEFDYGMKMKLNYE